MDFLLSRYQLERKATSLLVTLLFVATTTSCTYPSRDTDPAATDTELEIDRYHGYEHVDVLQYLEAKDEDGNPSQRTQSVIDKYNLSSEQFFAQHKQELDVIYNEIMSRRPKKSNNVPYNSKGMTFSSKTEDGERFPKMFYGKQNTNEKKLLIDQASRAKGSSDYLLYNKELSPDNTYLSWIEDTESGTLSTLYITLLGEPDNVIHKVEGVGRGLAWDDQSKRVYYVKLNDADRRYFQIRMYNMESKEDVEIYTELDDKYFTFAYASSSSNGLIIFNTNWSVSESMYIDFDTSYLVPQLIVDRKNAITFGMAVFGDTFIVSYESSPNESELASFEEPLADISIWNTLYSTKGSFVSYKATPKYFALIERREGADKVKYYDINARKMRDIDISDNRIGASFKSGQHDINNHILRMAYNSDLSMQTIIDVDLEQNSVSTLDAPVIPNFKSEDYEVVFKYIESHDGVMVPATIIKRKDTVLPAPVYQYTYGSYGYGIPPTLPWFALSLIDRGYVHVIAHVRGGDELGKQWHEAGRLMNRKNSFADFQAISRYLVKENYTTEGNISISGESAAGHILGVAVNESPKLYKSLTALVPAFDIFNKLLNSSLAVTKPSWSEFGNPTESKVFYDYIKSYAPIENIKPQEYPHYFITARLEDRNVDFFEPLKWSITVDKNITRPKFNYVSVEDGGHIRTGYGGKEYDFARQMLFILKAHEIEND